MSYEFPTKTSLRQEIYTKMVAIWQRVAGYTPPPGENPYKLPPTFNPDSNPNAKLV